MNLRIRNIKEITTSPKENLAHLERGESAVIKDISINCDPTNKRRLQDLGFLPGTTISVEEKGPFGDPVAYRVRGSVFALRKELSSLINIT